MEAGDINDAATLKRWLAVVLAEGGAFCDAVLFAHAHRAVEAGDDTALRTVAELAAAFAPSKERQLETTAQGNAFVEATRAAWPAPALDRLKAVWDGPVAYPVAVGTAAAGHGIAVEPALAAYLQAVAANLVSAGVRLIWVIYPRCRIAQVFRLDGSAGLLTADQELNGEDVVPGFTCKVRDILPPQPTGA